LADDPGTDAASQRPQQEPQVKRDPHVRLLHIQSGLQPLARHDQSRFTIPAQVALYSLSNREVAPMMRLRASSRDRRWGMSTFTLGIDCNSSTEVCRQKPTR